MRRCKKFVFLLALTAGCGDVNHASGEYTMSNNKTATSGNDAALPLAPMVPREDRPRPRESPPPHRPSLAATLVALPGSDVHGVASFEPSGQMSIVTVALRGGVSQTTYEGTIREGSCERLGSTVAALIPASADSTGRGAAISYASLPTDSLVKRRHVVVYGKGGRPQSCGVISGGGAALPAPPGPPPSPAAPPAAPDSAAAPADSTDA